MQILLRCMDPNDLSLRKNSHKHIAVIISNLVKIFPMVAFHNTTQRLAVGTYEGPIGIYDMRTSARLEVFDGHQGSVKCLCFDEKGKLLVSYSAADLSLKLWKVGDNSFFSQLMGGNNKVANQVSLKPLQKAQAQRIQADRLISETTTAEESHVESRCRVSFLEKDQKAVELTREDKSKEVYRIVK